MLEKLLNNEFLKEGMPLPNPKETKSISFLDNSKTFPAIYKEKFIDINNVPEKEIYEVLNGSLKLILENLYNADDNRLEKSLFTNQKFLSTLVQLLIDRNNRNEIMDLELLIRLNSFILICLNSKIEDELMRNTYVEMAYQTNKRAVDCLSPLVSREIAIDMALIYFRSNDNFVNIVRLNDYIIKLPKKFINEQLVIDIYTVFDYDLGVLGLSDLAKSLLFDFTIVENNNESENLSIMINALLAMIEQTPSITRIVLMNITNYYYGLGNGMCRGMRISLSRNISPSEYPNIVQTINRMRMEENILVP